MVCVLGASDGVHPAKPFYGPALPDNTSDRPGLAGLHRYEHRAFVFDVHVQCNLSADGKQP